MKTALLFSRTTAVASAAARAGRSTATSRSVGFPLRACSSFGTSTGAFSSSSPSPSTPSSSSSSALTNRRRTQGCWSSWHQEFMSAKCFSTTSTSAPQEDEQEPIDINIEITDDQEEQDQEEQDDEDDMGRKLKPREVVDQLDKYIVGQKDAKRAVAIALRNRWRRLKIPDDLRPEVSPKNILMIGPTGCGKTEIARRLAKLSEAPFVKVEATKFTEVGFHGRDVDQIIRDLVENAIHIVKKSRQERVRKDVQETVEKRLIRALTGHDTHGQWGELLRSGELEDRPIEVEVPVSQRGGPLQGFSISLSSSPDKGMPFSVNDSKKMERKTMTIAEARPILEEMEMEKMIDMGDVIREAVAETEENGIVFIDEVDKIVSTGEFRQADPSSEGVQRDLLPLIEGSVISTKHGNVNTDHILFIASGAFHSCKPSDLLAELQGRLPIRVELKGLTEEDLHRILTEPVTNLIKQQVELIKTEKVDLEFSPEAIREIAHVAAYVNQTVENIGARRLHTVLEKVVEEISFDAAEMAPGTKVVISKDFVEERVSSMLKKNDLSKFIL